MRTKPIIEIIRKHGLTSKRLSPKNRIKYEDAINAVKQYSTSKLEIKEVIDNTRTHTRNNCHCGLPGCGQRIRYEYILEDKDSNMDIVAGSTCVWPTLGLSELQAKEFFKYDEVIRNHYLLEDWKEQNPDVVDKLNKLKEINAVYYKAFWEEIEGSPLLKEDTDFIKSVDVDKEIQKKLYGDKFKNVNNSEYERAISYLPALLDYYKNNSMIKNFDRVVKSNKRLTGNQFRWLKIMVNRMWYETHIKGTSVDCMSTCESILKPIFSRTGYSSTDFESIDRIEDEVRNSSSKEVKMAWNLFKIKNAIVH